VFWLLFELSFVADFGVPARVCALDGIPLNCLYQSHVLFILIAKLPCIFQVAFLTKVK
jgi:hypothetical protein